MGRFGRFLQDHWHGRLRLVPTLVVALGLGHLVLAAGFAVLPTGNSVWMAIAGAACLLVWQVIGTLRATDRHITAGGDRALATLSYGLVLLVGVLTANLVVSAGLGPSAAVPVVAELHERSNLSRSDTRLVLKGEITLQSYYHARDLLEVGDAIRTVHLDSPGGSVQGARGLARLVQEAGLETHVTGVCNSACPLVFIAGTRRTMAEGSSLGFHAYQVGGYENLGGRMLLDRTEEERRDRAFYLARGIAPEFVAKVFETPHDDLWRPERAVLEAAGALSR